MTYTPPRWYCEMDKHEWEEDADTVMNDFQENIGNTFVHSYSLLSFILHIFRR